MSNIVMDTNVLLAVFKEILEKKIIEVCNRLGFDDSDVTWHIFDPKNKSNCILSQMLIGTRGKDYGYCNPKSKSIWISTFAIMNSEMHSIQSNFSTLNNNRLHPSSSDLLANVIIDEITHLQTNCNHGTSKYDNQLLSNLRMFYNGGIAIVND